MSVQAQSAESALDELERLFDTSCGADVARTARAAAQRRAFTLVDASDGDPRVARIALLDFAADMLAGLAVELAARPAELSALIAKTEVVAGVPRVDLGREVLRSPHLLEQPAKTGIDVELALLLALTEARAVSVWSLCADGGLEHLAHAGAFRTSVHQTRRLALALISDDSEDSLRDASVGGVRVECAEQSAVALVIRGSQAITEQQTLLIDAAVPVLTTLLERREPVRAGQADSAVIAAAERRLARLRFDLHDGPQQDVMLLADDLRALRSQLGSVLKSRTARKRVLGNVDELQARLVALDGDLRRISISVESPFLQPTSLPDALAQLTDDFASRTGIQPEIRLRGRFAGLTDSQHITLLGLFREALSNIRAHSDAERVTITLSCDATGVEATVTDDGQGFDPEATLLPAARDGRLGLVGMHERVRLLGGETRIDSRPGGPTVISVRLPAAPAGVPRRAG